MTLALLLEVRERRNSSRMGSVRPISRPSKKPTAKSPNPVATRNSILHILKVSKNGPGNSILAGGSGFRHALPLRGAQRRLDLLAYRLINLPFHGRQHKTELDLEIDESVSELDDSGSPWSIEVQTISFPGGACLQFAFQTFGNFLHAHSRFLACEIVLFLDVYLCHDCRCPQEPGCRRPEVSRACSNGIPTRFLSAARHLRRCGGIVPLGKRLGSCLIP